MSRRKKRIYLSLIGLSALGVLVDRLIMPAPAGGAELALPRLATRAAVKGTPPAPGAEAAEAPPAVVLAATRFPNQPADADPTPRDLFGPTEKVRSALLGAPAEGSGAEAGSDDRHLAQVRAAQFAQAHTLSAVVHDNEFAIAILEGAWVRMGQAIDGCTLVRILGQSAQFDCGGVTAELSVSRPQTED